MEFIKKNHFRPIIRKPIIIAEKAFNDDGKQIKRKTSLTDIQNASIEPY